MKTTTRYLIPAAILIFVAGLFFATTRHPLNERDQRPETAIAPLADASEPSRTKSKIRIHHPKRTIGETTELLENTMIPIVDLPGQSLSERILAINQLLENAGVPPGQLRIYCDKFNPVSKIELGKLRIQNISAAALLRLTAGSSDLRSIVKDGKVEITIPESDGID